MSTNDHPGSASPFPSSLEGEFGRLAKWVEGSPPHPLKQLHPESLSTVELHHLMEERILQKTRPKGVCIHCGSDEIPEISVLKVGDKVKFHAEVCCNSVSNLIQEWIAQASSRMEAWKEILNGDFPQGPPPASN